MLAVRASRPGDAESAMVKDLLVTTTGRGDDVAAFNAACTLARASDGHVAVLTQVRVPLPVGDAMGLFPADAFVAEHQRLRAAAEAGNQRWRERLAQAGVKGEVRLSEDLLTSPPLTAAIQARYADLAVIGLGAQDALPVEVHDQVATILARAGRPLLVVPSGTKPFAANRVLVAWQPSANASRALHEALPLLARASAIDVICVDPRRGERDHGEDPGADIARHLARHDLRVTVYVETGAGEEPGEVLLRRAHELGAGLLVMGGYGHSRLREWALGGTTRHVLRHAALPVLMSG